MSFHFSTQLLNRAGFLLSLSLSLSLSHTLTLTFVRNTGEPVFYSDGFPVSRVHARHRRSGARTEDNPRVHVRNFLPLLLTYSMH
jgi:hypothetical protein